MRKTNTLMLIAIVAITSLVSSCKKETVTNLADDQNATEETKIPTSILETGIEIEGASKETGTPPAPNSNLDFQLNTDLTEAFQGSGLEIEFSSTESIAGAYIQFKDVDGNPASNYFDVSLTSADNGDFRIVRKEEPIKKSLSNVRAHQDSTDVIEVDFDSNVPAGQFCYDICLYDASGNVSQPQTVCVTVEAWGGNASIVGEWIFDKDNYDESEESASITCTNGQTIEADYYEVIKDEGTLALNEDGTFSYISYSEGRDLNDSTSSENCSATYGPAYKYNEKTSGNWAYNEDKQTLTLIEFKYEDLLDASYNEDFEDGYVFFDGAAEIVSDQLVLSATDEGETDILYYNKK